MALGTTTVVNRSKGYPREVTITVPIASYTSGGETPTAATFGLRALAGRKVSVDSPVSSNGFFIRWDGTKVRAYAPIKVTDSDTPGGAAVNFDDSGGTFESTTAGNADAYPAGEEVPAATNVGTVTLTGYGYP